MIRYFVLVLLLTSMFAHSSDWSEYYAVKKIPIPKEINPQVGGLIVLSDGRIAVAFHAGEVMIYAPETQIWTQYAKGLHEPLGLVEEGPNALVVMQMAELTRLVDENDDGTADFYQTISDQFGMSGNYHEFAFGPAVDSKGNYYIALNVASNFAGVFNYIRGQFSPIGLPQNIMTDWRSEQWQSEHKFKAGRMFSKVPYRGWVLKITPDGKTSPFASGFRSPDGIFVDKLDRIWVTDNQGDWKGTSPLYLVEKDKFYGHPASLVWNENWQQDPVQMSAFELKQLSSPAAALFPHGELANSPTQPISTIGLDKFGLPEGELLIGDMNQPRLIRFLSDSAKGIAQGTLIPFLEHKELGIGNHRMSFDESGNLYIGKTHLGWAGDEGISKISWNKKPLLLVTKVEQKNGIFELSFNRPINTASFKLTLTSHTYHYHSEYGSEKVDLTDRAVTNIVFKDNDTKVKFSVDKLLEGNLYTINLNSVVDQDDAPLMGSILYYNLVKRR